MSVEIITFGCRLNIYESEIIKNIAKKYDNNKEKIIIFNSCTVTAEAEKQLRQAIRKQRKENPNAIIGVVGCAISTNKEIYENMPEINFIFGNWDKMNEKNYCNICNTLQNQKFVITNVLELASLSSHLISGFANKTRGFIQIQNGCDNSCSFCATRLARGKSVSVPSSEIISEINSLIENGYNEIVLTGIDITNYGNRLQEKMNLGKLIQKILKETSLKRLRLSSIDIADLNDDLKEALFNEDRLMPHIHISLQSGDDLILKRMKRRHTRQQVINFYNEITLYRKNIAIGCDLIAGFPTETQAMHLNSCELIKEINIVFGHIFPYSIRENTTAAKMPQIAMEIRKKRAKELREICNLQLEIFLKNQLLLPQKILIETEKIGRTENYLSVPLTLRQIEGHRIGDIIEYKYFI